MPPQVQLGGRRRRRSQGDGGAGSGGSPTNYYTPLALARQALGGVPLVKRGSASELALGRSAPGQALRPIWLAPAKMKSSVRRSGLVTAYTRTAATLGSDNVGDPYLLSGPVDLGQDTTSRRRGEVDDLNREGGCSGVAVVGNSKVGTTLKGGPVDERDACCRTS